jgi:Cytochrome c
VKPNRPRSQLTAALALFGCITLSACGGGGQDESAALPIDPNACTMGPAQTPVDTAFCRGKANFHDRTLAGLGGNGRACSDCHMDTENFQLTPAAAQARFAQMTMTGIDDPLFRAIDANDFRANGAAAHNFTNLMQNGLIRVTIPLPANVKLLDCGAAVLCPASARPTSETVADVWRSVPSIFDAKITGPDGAAPEWARGPNQRGGYQLDGRIDTLQNQALSALRNHAGVTVDPPVSFLDDVVVFQQAQFSSASVKRLSDAMAAGTSPLPDPDPVLDGLEMAGKSVFNRACGQCHGNMGGASPQPACVTRVTTSDPGRLLLTGYPVAGGPGDIQHMDIPNLRGISRTAPYFMNNTAATLEEMLEHYKQFFKRVQVQNAAAPLLTTQPGVTPPVIDRPFTDAEVPALLAYLRKL